MIGELGFQIGSLIYMLMLLAVYLSTKKTETVENKIFTELIFTEILAIVLDMSTVITAYMNPDLVSLVIILEKVFKIVAIRYLFLFTKYILLVVNKTLTQDQKLIRYKNYDLISSIGMLLTTFAMLLLPANGSITMHGTYGIDTYVSYAICGIFTIVWGIGIYLHRDQVVLRNVIPVIVEAVFGAIGIAIEYVNTDCHTLSASMAFVLLVMYFMVFTIENPDVKMVEEITAARNEAEKANQSKTDFLADMSHEIRTPLNAIQGFSQGLLEEEIPDSAKDDVEDIISASDSLLDIVNEILDISKIETNKLELINSEYTINKVYKYLVSLTEGRIGSKQLQFIHSCSNDIPPVLFGDNARIKQIAVNLLTNSVKYTKDGFIKLNLSYEKIDDDNGYLIIAVQDSGIGIKEENLHKLFSKFERFDLKENINVEGTGLGLALTKRLIDLMEGKIIVESRYGEGSTFTVKLKQKVIHKDVSEVDEVSPIDIGQFTGNGENILIVDDNSVNLKVACRLLRKYNFNIDTSNGGKDCINKVKMKDYDLILLDDLMPEISGVETLKRLKENPYFDTPVVALTANAIAGMKEHYIEKGFDDYISKPINKAVLEDVLVKLIAKREKKEKREEIIETAEDRKDILTSLTNPKNNTSFLEHNGVSMAQAMETLGDMSIYNETAKMFVDEIESKLKDLKRFYDKKDLKNYTIMAHSLKSDARYLGITKMFDLAQQHELAGKDGNWDYIINNYEELVYEIKKMHTIMKKYVG